MAARALITGISGQDGSYLAELLVSKGYDVHGTIRAELAKTPHLLPRVLLSLKDRVTLHTANLEKPHELAALLRRLDCEECYHLAGPSTVDSNLIGEPAVFSTIVHSTRALLDAVVATGRRCRFLFAGSSEMFGRAAHTPQNEDTPYQPRSLYGLAKLAGFHTVGLYKRRHGLFACTSILFNHESPRRSPLFLPRKVTLAAARIKLGLQQRLVLGNLEARRDWGYAPDYVEAMWLMLQQPAPQDFVVATGGTHRVRELVEMAFGSVALDYQAFVDVDAQFVRPAEAVPLCGDYGRLRAATGWQPRKTLEEIVREMVAHDMAGQAASAESARP